MNKMQKNWKSIHVLIHKQRTRWKIISPVDEENLSDKIQLWFMIKNYIQHFSVVLEL